jgi:hypothetical protein
MLPSKPILTAETFSMLPTDAQEYILDCLRDLNDTKCRVYPTSVIISITTGMSSRVLLHRFTGMEGTTHA